MKKVVICNGIEKIDEFISFAEGKQVCFFSKDAELVDKLRQLGYETYFLEADTRIKTVIENTNRLLDHISEKQEVCFEQLSIEKRYLYEVSYKMEGSSIGRRLMDAYYTNWLICEFVKKQHVEQIVCFYSDQFAEECEFLYYLARELRVKFKCIFPKVKTALSYRTRLLCYGGPFWVAMVMLFNSIRQGFLQDKRCNINPKLAGDEYDIGILKQGAKQKDFNWTNENYKLLTENGFRVCIIATANEVANKWNQEGYRVVSYESYVNKKDMFRVRWSYLWSAFRIVMAMNKIDYELQGTGVGKELLMYMIKAQYCEQAIADIRYDKGAENFFKNNRFKIISYNGDTNYVSSKISFFNCRNSGQSNTRFQNCWGSLQTFYLPYGEPHKERSQFSFVLGNKYVMNHSAGVNCYMGKNLYYTKLAQRDFKQTYNSVPVFLWAPSYPLRGSLTRSFFDKCNENLINSFRKNEGELWIKYHPNTLLLDVDNHIREAEKIKNVTVWDKKNNILELLEKADCLISVTSLTILEAVYLKKPVICLADEAISELLDTHKDGLFIVHDFEMLTKLLNEFSKDKISFENWKKQVLQKQNAHFEKYIGKNEADVEIKKLEVYRKEIAIYDKLEG